MVVWRVGEMLGSFGSSSSHHHHDHDRHDEDPPVAPPPDHHQITAPSASIHIRQLLLSCAELIFRSDFSAVPRLLAVLSANSSPYGDSTERLVHQFTRSLSLRLSKITGSAAVVACETPPPDAAALVRSSSYLSLNQITPFIRFAHLTANQAILEAIEGHAAIHIIDFDIMHGVQWPPLMQAIAERFPAPALRITGTGADLDILRRTGDRLAKFAHSLCLRFQFHPLLLNTAEDGVSSTALSPLTSLLLIPGETLVVNCVLHLHRLLADRDRLRLFLRRIKAMAPAIVTVAEREGDHNHPMFLNRFADALDHYAAVFDSLEATLPPNSRERLAVEQVWFGREIADIVAAEGENRRERHERFTSWEVMLRDSGYNNVPLSPFAVSQAKLLLRLHYPSGGYRLHILENSFFLGWQNQPLFSVSSWH